jgi:hypothetical protein
MQLAKRTLLAGTTGLVTIATFGGVAFAQTGSSSSASSTDSAACSDALEKQTSVMLSAMDTLLAAQKAALKTRSDAFRSALTLGKASGHGAAVQSAEDTFRSSMNTAMAAYRDTVSPGADAMKAACKGLGNGIIGSPTSPIELKTMKEDKKVFQAKVIKNAPKAAGMMRKARQLDAQRRAAKKSSSSRSSASSASSTSSSTAQ